MPAAPCQHDFGRTGNGRGVIASMARDEVRHKGQRRPAILARQGMKRRPRSVQPQL